MNPDEQEDVILLDRPVIYVEPDDVDDESIGPDDVTAKYVLGQVEDSYDEVVEIDPIDGRDTEDDDVVLLETMRLEPADLEVA